MVDDIRFSGEWMQAFRDHQLKNSQAFDHLASLRQHPIQLFAIHGEKDMRFPVSVAKRLRQDVSTCQLAIIPDAGHLSYIDKPNEWQVQLSRFLSSMSKPPG